MNASAWANEVIVGAPLAPEPPAAADDLTLAQARATAPDVPAAIARSEAAAARFDQLIQAGQAARGEGASGLRFDTALPTGGG